MNNRMMSMIETDHNLNSYKKEKKDSMNKTFYSFGGHTPIKSAYNHRD